MGFSRQEYWSELPFPSPEDLLNPGIEPRSPALQPDSLLMELQGKPLTLPYVKGLRKFKQGLCINLEGWDGEGNGREVQKEGDMCIPMAGFK